MNNELTLFAGFDIESQQKTWHVGLSDELQTKLKQRAVNIKVIYLQATLKIGEQLAEAQKELVYRDGGFVKWCEEEAGIDNPRAYEYIQIWENFKMFSLSENITSIGKKVLLAASKKDVPQSAREEIVERHQSGEKVTTKDAKDIIEKHKEAARLARERAENAEEQLRQTRLDAVDRVKSLKWEHQEAIDQLNEQIDELNRQVNTIQAPKEKVVEVIPEETQHRLKALEEQIATLQRQKNNLKEQNEQLAKDLEVQEGVREQEERDARVRLEWKNATSATSQSVLKFLGQLPLPADMERFDADEWARLDQMIAVFERGIDACRSLKSSSVPMIIDAAPARG